MVMGYQRMDPQLRVSAVVCNRVNSKAHFHWIQQALDSQRVALQDPSTQQPLLVAGKLPINQSIAFSRFDGSQHP